MFFKKISILVAVIIASIGSTANAEITDNSFSLDIQVGADNYGNPIILDLASVKGTEYTLSQKHGDGVAKTTLQAACNQGKLYATRFAVYNSTGKLTSNQTIEREIVLKPDTADANATSMQIVCRAANKLGSE
ncbi:hypothetical protein [Anabaena sp. CCY 9613]|uniref:hypothetical protein n=1 Tax=Anabaena sp. CCY 9613 TaxID=3103868 RepID=UPI0039C6DEF2